MYGFIFELCLITLGLLAALYYYLISNYDYWRARNVKGPKPAIVFGTFKDVMMNKLSMGDYVTKIYNETKNEPYAGIFIRRKPILILNDLDLIKDVLIKDFGNFVDRGTSTHDKVEPLSAHLFNLEARRWRPLRSRLSPVFTSGKLKEMFYLLVECSNALDKYLEDIVDKSGQAKIEFRELTAKFTTDVIGVCAFGLQMNSLASEDSTFRRIGRKLFDTSNWRTLLQLRLRTLAPSLYDIIGHFLVDRELNDFFIDTMRQTMDYRKKSGVVKHDFIDLLMAVRDHPDKIPEVELTDGLLAAQLFVFFVAGFETSSGTMSHTFYELALNPEIQDKLKEEINETLKQNNDIIDYEMIKSMKYLDMVFNETLRKYPPVTFLMRKSSKAYTFETTSKDRLLSIEANQVIWLPAYAIQKDERYWPEPEVFDPERFNEKAVNERHPMTYLPFGDGPRNCIGKRFGVMQTKVGLVKILSRYSVRVSEKTQIPYVVNPKAFLLSPLNGIHLKIVRDDKNSTEL